jgi:branched-chain amino acid aminotransferase
LLDLARHEGQTVVERAIPVDELLDDIRSGRCSEFFACGTAAIVAPISAVGERNGSVVELAETGRVAMQLRSAILDIQEGRSDDPFGWMVDAADLEALLFRMSPGTE